MGKLSKLLFFGGQNTSYLITYNDKMVIPEKLLKYVVKCYHMYLPNPGLDIT